MSELTGAVMVNGTPCCTRCGNDITEQGRVMLIRLWDDRNKAGCDYICACGQVITQKDGEDDVH